MAFIDQEASEKAEEIDAKVYADNILITNLWSSFIMHRSEIWMSDFSLFENWLFIYYVASGISCVRVLDCFHAIFRCCDIKNFSYVVLHFLIYAHITAYKA